jgi:8-amino-7-oxononanoate synthase
VTALGRVARRWGLGPTNGETHPTARPRSAAAAGRPVLRLEPPPVATPPADPPAASGAYAPLLEKCHRYTRAREVRASGLYPYFHPISDSEDTVVVIEGRRRIMLGSNNYLGLTHHPKVIEAAEAALRRYGTGCTGSRFLNGTLDLHCRLEDALATFVGKETCLVFSTGYMANLGVVAGLVSRRDVVYLDKLDHASIVDGAQLSAGEVVRFNHGDLADLERKLAARRDNGHALVMVDGVYSMEGNIADLPGLLGVTRRFGAALAVDDAHSVGVLGPNGQGTAAHLGVTAEVDLIAGTFSKSLASIGGFVAGSAEVIDYLKHHSRPLIFSASLPPASTAGTLAALEVLQVEPDRRARLWDNTRRLQAGFRELGFDIGPTQTPIIPVLVGTVDRTFLFWRRLFDAGVFTNPVIPPAVPPAECRLRTSVMATHTPEQIDASLEAFARIGRELGVV